MAMSTVIASALELPNAAVLRQRAHWTDRIAHAALLLVVVALDRKSVV